MVMAVAFSALCLPVQAATTTAPPAPAPAPAAMPTGGTWNKVCGNDSVCYVEQLALVAPQKTPILSVRFDRQGGNGRGRIVLITPLGVSLRAGGGVRLVIDAHDPITIPYEVCAPIGCLTQAVLEADSLTSFETAKALTVTYVMADGKPQAVPVNLAGLSAALKSLGK